MLSRNRIILISIGSAVLAAGALAPTPSIAASGPVPHHAVVSADPVDWTPHVLNGIVNALALVNGKVVVGGKFSRVRNAGESRELARANLFAFDLATGKIDERFAPELDGPVHALAPGAAGTVYVGGSFDTVNHWPAHALTRLSMSDGRAVYGFAPWVSGGDVSSLVARGSHLYVGGDFHRIGDAQRSAIARLDARSGAVDPAFAVTPGRPRGGQLKVYAMALAGDRLAVDGSFTTLDRLSRPQLGLIDVGSTPARVAPWRTSAYAADCWSVFPSYVRGLDFSPDGKYFVVVTTGGPKHRGGTGPTCDSAARFETHSTGGDIRPTWVNHTGGDSLYSVEVTGAAVYVGGHQRWLDNPHGSDTRGPGAVSRPGIGAIHPVTGRALPWNPTRTRGIGVKAFLAHKGGLIVGSDTTRLGREYHARVGMFPTGR
ncbi:delta-60 repeat domain-containing protein [Thermopolyspora sp. NPDC052614]|uniref:delta-60 repeat domain-containing protein n=1 Tax=Thermopolyspora sp. NPDC052614 TaxID=3155682 RepID=UPI0034450289